MSPGPYRRPGSGPGAAPVASDIVVHGQRSDSTVRLGPLSGLGALADPAKTVLVADELTLGLAPQGFDRERAAIVPRGEAAKCLAGLEAVYGRFLELGVGRDWTVVGLGGGSVSDLAGLAASTWMRGVDFGFAPTTLLSMVDASVGGKNGIDFGGYKNLIGSFNQPRFVLADTAALGSLPPFDLACGLAEAIKHGLIEGERHLALIESAVRPDGTVDPARLQALVEASVRLKASIASADERESGERRKLNLGHTIGHAIESATGLPHGACVAAGIATALRLAVERGGSRADAERALALLSRAGLPTGIEEARAMSNAVTAGAGAPEPAAFRSAIADAIGADKKRVGGDILFAMPMAIGDVRVEPLPLEQAREFARRAP